MRKTMGLALVGWLWLAIGPGAAVAQDKPADRPWAKGVTAEEQRAALNLFQEGNALLKESLFPRAAARYNDALKHWDHPAIHYNLALALLQMNDPIQVYDHLEKAMKYGEAPLDREKFQHAKAYHSLIAEQLAHVVISCQDAGATITLDGRQLFAAPGKYEGMIRAGPHTVLASKTGYPTTEDTRTFLPGVVTQVSLKMYTAEDLTRYKRRWKQGIPWATVAAGAALVAAGAVFQWQSGKNFDDYDAAIRSCGGCVPPEDVASKKSTGETMRTLSIVSYGVGGAALVTGAVLVYMNRAQAYRISPAEREGRVSVAPVLAPNAQGAVVTMHF
jgi:tetratricopeptide (TPR) repeat protein